MDEGNADGAWELMVSCADDPEKTDARRHSTAIYPEMYYPQFLFLGYQLERSHR